MAFDLRYHPKVTSEDLPKIPAQARRRIATAIETRLAVSPQRYGIPLRGPLREYWKLRVGDYRVVYAITSKVVLIIAIIHRKDVYQRSERRISG